MVPFDLLPHVLDAGATDEYARFLAAHPFPRIIDATDPPPSSRDEDDDEDDPR